MISIPKTIVDCYQIETIILSYGEQGGTIISSKFNCTRIKWSNGQGGWIEINADKSIHYTLSPLISAIDE